MAIKAWTLETKVRVEALLSALMSAKPSRADRCLPLAVASTLYMESKPDCYYVFFVSYNFLIFFLNGHPPGQNVF
jgi:hypothetical protein